MKLGYRNGIRRSTLVSALTLALASSGVASSDWAAQASVPLSSTQIVAGADIAAPLRSARDSYASDSTSQLNRSGEPGLPDFGPQRAANPPGGGAALGETDPAPPPPIDPRNPRFIPDTTPYLNVVGQAGTVIPDLARDRLRGVVNPAASPWPGTGDAGAWITAQSFGVYAGFDVELDVFLPDVGIDLTLYAPTMVNRDPYNAGRFGCLETVTAHYRYPATMFDTAHGHGFYDHCSAQPGFKSFKFMTDPAWQNAYVRFQEGENRFYTMVWLDTATNTTRGMLWNYNLGIWEEQYQVTSLNTLASTGGWTMFETYGFASGYCGALPPIRASGTLVLRSDGTWTALTTADSFPLGPTGFCFSGGSYTFHFHNQNWEWEVHD
jgi:hypothetical protein